MRTVDEALALIIGNSPPLSDTVEVPVQDSPGRVLAEDVVSDSDLPAFDRSAMDGFAVRAEDLRDPPVSLKILEDIHAGDVGTRTVVPGTASRIMTGAAIPDGADAVVMVEYTEPGDGPDDVRVGRAIEPKANIRFRAENVALGEVVRSIGSVVRPVDIAILCTAGRTTVSVRRRPRATVLATGDELVDPGSEPGAGKIRNSNGPMLVSQLRAVGADVAMMSIVRDEPDTLRAAVRAGLESDVLLLTGGVSMGTKDHVAEVLAEEGVETVFHRVAMKPGKPILFGKKGGALVFGLPGNPVSVFLGFHVFVRPCLAALEGRPSREGRLLPAIARGSVRGSPKLRVYEPCRLEREGDDWGVHRVRYSGSGDIHGAARGDGFVVIEAGTEAVVEGDRVGVLRMDEA